MNVAFVGIKRKFQELSADYREFFVKYHLELPYYYAAHGPNDVRITTVDYSSPTGGYRAGDGWVDLQQEKEFVNDPQEFDVVVHWRKWFPELYRPEAINIINCQDHSFSPEWKQSVLQAYSEGKLKGILCFPTWHKRNLQQETGLPESALLDGVTLGVDTDVYSPSPDKDPYQMLWASDPGRGFDSAIGLAVRLFQKDKRFRLHICYPDYVRPPPHTPHPALVWHGSVPNGPKLWDLFNKCGVLPYTSTFREPSSRAHRQAMAAGSLVLYPPAMGSPSELIQNGVNGVVSNPMEWLNTIPRLVESGQWKNIGALAREYAVSENWQVQAKRFNQLFERILES